MASGDERQPLLVKNIIGNTTVIRPTTQRQIACAAILVAEMFERVACFGLSGNLVFMLSAEPFCWMSSLATTAELVFTAMMYVTGLFGGWISDSYLGRYPTIIIGYIIYSLGYLYLPVLTWYSQYTYTPNISAIFIEGTPCNSTWENDCTPPFCNKSFDGSSNCSVSLFISIILIAIGAGIVRTNLAPFGGDQVRYLHYVLLGYDCNVGPRHTAMS